MTFDLIVLGHLTHDTIVTSNKRIHKTLGGAAAYTSLTAVKLGAIVGIVTKVGMDFNNVYLEYLQRANIDLLGLKVKMGKTTAFENTYNEGGRRTQRLLNYTQPIETGDVPAAYINARCFHFGPVFHEVSYDIIKFAHEKSILTSAGFIVEYLRTKNPKPSALFASCVASFVVEGIGTTTLPTKEKVMRRLGRYVTSLT